MTFGTGFAIYFLFWWLTLFAVLPFGIRSQADDEDRILGTEPGAPRKTNVGKKLLANTLLAGVVFFIYWYITEVAGYSLNNIPSLFPDDLE